MPPIIHTTMHRRNNYPFLDVPQSESTWRANCRLIAYEVNNETISGKSGKMFRGKITWELISVICREMLRANAPKPSRRN